MRALLYLNDYGSDSEKSEYEEEQQTSRKKLPVPSLDKVLVVKKDDHIDDPEQHHGRVRSFPHIRGNWPSFVYVICQLEQESLNKIINIIESKTSAIGTLERIHELHISLSKTVTFQYHMITTFTESLKESIQNIPSFYVEYQSIKVYCNDNKTRTFIALQLDSFSYKNLLKLVQKVDATLVEFGQVQFYEDPSFHVSILWMNGNKKEAIEEVLQEANLKDQILNLEPYFIDKIFSKIGNKNFQFSLD